ncbi:ComEA family DNA-binding protein [Streptomyces sp. NPDC047860]|uniref:ComEA family DNA-binding protein n=1 Tax=Streptomyces sp. NPDC047860 TaxID=3155743 RepID=UPI0033F4110C
MALRSRSRTAHATSGPGRAPASDHRVRHRRPGRPRYRARERERPPSAEELRRRAETLFGESEAIRGQSGGTGGRAGTPQAPTPAGDRRAGRVPSWATNPAGRAAPLAAVNHSTTADTSRRTAATTYRPVTGSRTIVVRSLTPGRTPAAAQVADSHHPPPGRKEPASGATDVPPTTHDPEPPPDRRPNRAALALRERLPLWVQIHCGLERRSVIALSALLVLVLGFAVQHFWAGRTQPVKAPEVVRAAVPHGERAAEKDSFPAAPAGAAKTGASAAPEIVVDVSGKVRDPGIHRLPAGSRVEDALRAAGGVRPGTKTDTLNRARFLVDGEQLVVGGPAPAGASQAPAPAPGTGTAAAGPPTPVSLNTATLDQLDALPGVGPVLAQHIVDHRTRTGGFRSVDELRDVNGIGDRRFADLRNLVRP